MSNGKSYLKDSQADLREKRAAMLRDRADATVDEVSEALAAEEAETEPEFRFVDGEQLPQGFSNPPGGEPGHKCVRVMLAPNKQRFIVVYKPGWKQVFIHKVGSEQAERQFFMTMELGPVRVPTNRWVDVPAEVVAILQDCKYEKTTIDEEAAKKSLLQSAPLTIEYIPRFSFQSMPSA